ncbi:MAG: hypothetical protein ACE5FH_07875 [Candidatus Zixiibacteriota bacterium]
MAKIDKLTVPKLYWQKATCVVCGNSFDYISMRRPRTCNNGDCRHAYHYKIDPHLWASYQPTFFDK